MVRDISDTSVQLSWSRGFDNHSPIAKYTLQARTLPSGKWKQVRTSKCEVLPRSVLVSLVVQMVKNPPAMWDTWVRSWVGKIPRRKS